MNFRTICEKDEFELGRDYAFPLLILNCFFGDEWLFLKMHLHYFHRSANIISAGDCCLQPLRINGLSIEHGTSGNRFLD